MTAKSVPVTLSHVTKIFKDPKGKGGQDYHASDDRRL